MNVEVDINKNDYWNYNKYLIKHMPKFTRSFILNMLSMPITVLIVMIMLKKSIISTAIMTVVIGALGDLFLIYMIKLQVNRSAAKRQDILGKRTFELYNKGIKEVSEIKNQMRTWKSVRDIKEDKDNIYIFLGGFEVNLIPKRSFESQELSQEFYDKCMEYYANSKNK
ncbi:MULTISPECIES: YcxB family protein [Clostridium]|uniref:YcxB-like C-terminal domain-containing protein n=1 Tax=Clostridium novyi (strain NT) TaxID=386415 RepID=A0Q378_CLONN|nr:MULTISPECIES: YcxB family protein [Clostridium]ABK61709.1 hypothetical protein NT01CX_0614 [Clostridium novyi NT]KEH87536.1 hypothetical protein Z966_10825 [Clostridium novyi A str. NCTC 538]KEH91168.1 hypothetical protein Z965_05875 [Clostridium novyi A str. BKT29909]KEH94831.1 hypothetical protein Z963_07635 [Clostridium botulinum C/D str. It1]